MKEYTLYYSVSNGGDGSAYPHFMESEELCQWDQDHMSEGWGESCTGSFTLKSPSDILPVDKVETKESYFVERYMDAYDCDNEEAAEFIAQFFPDGLPHFTVTTEETGNPEYLYNNVFVGERQVAKVFKEKGGSGSVFEGLLNGMNLRSE
jgi:hypothetical protein